MNTVHYTEKYGWQLLRKSQHDGHNTKWAGNQETERSLLSIFVASRERRGEETSIIL